MFSKIMVTFSLLLSVTIVANVSAEEVSNAKFEAFVVSLKTAANNDNFKQYDDVFYQDSLIPSYRYAYPLDSDIDHKEDVVSQAKNYFSDTDYLITVGEEYSCLNNLCEYKHHSKQKDPIFKDVSTSSQHFSYKNGSWLQLSVLYPTLSQLKIIDTLDNFYTIYFAFSGIEKMNIYVNGDFVVEANRSSGLRLYAIKKGVNTIKIVVPDMDSANKMFDLGLGIAFVDRKKSRSKMTTSNIIGGTFTEGYFDKEMTTKVQYIDGGLEYKFEI